MGLDMYLEKCNRKAWGFKDIDIDEAKEKNPKLYEEIKPYLHERGEYFHWESIFEEVGYWRKANAIHKWFVDNVQDGNDDCGYYEVSKEKMEELLQICINVVVNPEIAEKLLPTTAGFFFGSTNYDQWYIEDIKETIDILTRALETTNFDLEMIVYGSSW